MKPEYLPHLRLAYQGDAALRRTVVSLQRMEHFGTTGFPVREWHYMPLFYMLFI